MKMFCLKCENGHTWKTTGTWEEGMPAAYFDQADCRICGSGLITLLYSEELQ